MKHYGKADWHPQSWKFDMPSICQTLAKSAIAEGDAMRERLRGKRILEIRV